MCNQSLKENERCPINPLALAHYFGLNEPEKDELDANDEAKELSISYRVMKEKEKSDALRKIIDGGLNTLKVTASFMVTKKKLSNCHHGWHK